MCGNCGWQVVCQDAQFLALDLAGLMEPPWLRDLQRQALDLAYQVEQAEHASPEEEYRGQLMRMAALRAGVPMQVRP
jgi:hypothetical protein